MNDQRTTRAERFHRYRERREQRAIERTRRVQTLNTPFPLAGVDVEPKTPEGISITPNLSRTLAHVMGYDGVGCRVMGGWPLGALWVAPPDLSRAVQHVDGRTVSAGSFSSWLVGEYCQYWIIHAHKGALNFVSFFHPGSMSAFRVYHKSLAEVSAGGIMQTFEAWGTANQLSYTNYMSGVDVDVEAVGYQFKELIE